MKRVILFAAIISVASLQNASPGNSDVEVHCMPNKIGQDIKLDTKQSSRQAAKERWKYDVTLENKTFKEMTNVEIKYIVFYTQEHFGSKDPASARRKNGSLSFPSIKPREKKSFSTEPVELKKAQLNSGWYFADGGKEKAQDALTGIWVRVYQNGEQFAEYANPSNLTKEQWK